MSKAAADGETALERWVDGLLESTDSRALVLDVLRFTDGASPVEDPTDRDDEDEKPQIVIPDVPPFDEGGQPPEGGLPVGDSPA